MGETGAAVSSGFSLLRDKKNSSENGNLFHSVLWALLQPTPQPLFKKTPTIYVEDETDWD